MEAHNKRSRQPYASLVDEFRRVVVEQDAVDDGSKLITNNGVILLTILGEVHIFLFLEADFQVWDVHHSERKGISNNDFAHIALRLNVQTLRRHEQYENTINTMREITIV